MNEEECVIYIKTKNIVDIEASQREKFICRAFEIYPASCEQ